MFTNQVFDLQLLIHDHLGSLSDFVPIRALQNRKFVIKDTHYLFFHLFNVCLSLITCLFNRQSLNSIWIFVASFFDAVELPFRFTVEQGHPQLHLFTHVVAALLWKLEHVLEHSWHFRRIVLQLDVRLVDRHHIFDQMSYGFWKWNGDIVPLRWFNLLQGIDYFGSILNLIFQDRILFATDHFFENSSGVFGLL